ncbi:FMN-dependent NADPH-azoreductase [Pigmentiphaga humi]|uniref:FMN-dependent NADPH-azoreductase n=1 Tax=Pigmentiphaga humi TaxID=2478468 RepID=A0A3P4AXY3_9BURK|nr:NADPH-dependent FMN reductase [Pigmentiphaga humi]VCU68226.1 FMN-dependent NADPH-azoreductase [Pigmentiphaga humi]
MPLHVPRIVALGGTTRPDSSTERALRHALDAAAATGAQVAMLAGDDLVLPMYAPHDSARTPAALRLVDELRRADGVIIASPGYHGSLSGLVKNALDYAEDLRTDARPYLSGRAVGCIANAAGWQAAVATLGALRDIVHALRGWPTPLGVCIGGTDPAFAPDGSCIDPRTDEQLRTLALEVAGFAHRMRGQAPCRPDAIRAAA